jgi:hypothetical protein
MMTKRVLEVGNCAADYAALRALVERKFSATLARAVNATRWPHCAQSLLTWCWSIACSLAVARASPSWCGSRMNDAGCGLLSVWTTGG